MVCERCISAVATILQQEGISYDLIQLGEVDIPCTPNSHQLENLHHSLSNAGFELLDDVKAKLVEKIKNVIIELVHRNEAVLMVKLSALLEDKLQKDYNYLSTLFSSVEGLTIEKYAILQRVEKAKELLTYDELSLGEMAEKMGYSSVQHLSQQFKKETGLTPSGFRQLKEKHRKPLDKI